MTYSMRISLDDRPGSLAEIAAALGDIGANIVELDVLERSLEHAIDQLVVQAPGSSGEAVTDAVERIEGARVESLRSTRRHAGLPPLGLAVRLGRAARDEVLSVLVRGTVVSFDATWSAVVRDHGQQVEVVVASEQAPNLAEVPTPWLPLRDVRRVPQGPWTPASWLVDDEPLSLAAAPLRSATEALVVCRPEGPRFAQRELGDLAMLADLAVAQLGSDAVLV